jgi:galactosylceramidase
MKKTSTLPAALLLASLACLVLPAQAAAPAAASGSETTIRLDANDTGRIFEGVGAVSAGASSRNLVDFPEPQRSQILDCLFKPSFGASLQHLKVEIGGDDNSTCGSEPSHAITREELKNPKARGYEFWLMAEARKRNPRILLDCLPWCYPGWIKGRFSQDSADWFAAFLEVAKQQYNLDLDWVGAAQNERGTDLDWVANTLRPTLDQRGFAKVKLQGPDDANATWAISEKLSKNPAYDKAIQAVTYHYISEWLPRIEDESRRAPEALKATGKPLWSSEEFSMSGKDWKGALLWAQLINKLYIRDRITKVNVWCPIASILPGLEWVDTGLMQANQSWSGHYDVWPAIWTTAHITQFAQPGWRYLDQACGQFNPKTWTGTHVALHDPSGKDWSMIMCTANAEAIHVKTASNLSQGPVHVWKSTAAEQFVKMPDVAVNQGAFSLVLEPNAIYSLTTTTGQQKGAYPASPEARPFPLPFTENFDGYPPGVTPKYFSDQKGTFETASRADGGVCLKQIAPKQGILWLRAFRIPYTVWGDAAWKDYSVQADVLVNGGSVEVGGRFTGRMEASLSTSIVLKQDGAWALIAHAHVEEVKTTNGKSKKTTVPKMLASGQLAGFQPDKWHTLKISFVGTHVSVFIDGKAAGDAEDGSCAAGLAFLASSYAPNCFDNIQVEPAK